MRITFLGVGEACDTRHGNTSVLLEQGTFRLLLDCGFSVPHRFFRYCDRGDDLDAVWISHFHGDHFLGLPLLLLRLWEMGRTRPLTLIGQVEIAQKWRAAMELAYPGFTAKLTFAVQVMTIPPSQPVILGPLTLAAIPTIHSQPNHGLLVDHCGQRLYYSGDGRPTPEVASLIQGCRLAIHEAFTLEDRIPNHGSVKTCIHLTREAKVQRMGLVHLERKTRRLTRELALLTAEEPRLFLATEDQCIDLDAP